MTINGIRSEIEGVLQVEGPNDLLITTTNIASYLPEVVAKISSELDAWGLIPSTADPIGDSDEFLRSREAANHPYRKEFNSLFSEVDTLAIDLNVIPDANFDINMACTYTNDNKIVWKIFEEEADKLGLNFGFFMCPTESCHLPVRAQHLARKNEVNSNYLSLYFDESRLQLGEKIDDITELVKNVYTRWKEEKGTTKDVDTKEVCRFMGSRIKAIEKKTSLGLNPGTSHKIMDRAGEVHLFRNILVKYKASSGFSLKVSGGDTFRRTFFPEGGFCYARIPIGMYDRSGSPSGVPRLEDAEIYCGEDLDKIKKVMLNTDEPFEIINIEELEELL